MDKSEIYEKAENIIQKRRIDAINLNNKRIAEINKLIPEIAEMNNQIFNTSREIFKILAEGKNVDKKMAELKRENTEAQMVIRSLLRNNKYPPDYLDVHYTCKDCNDTGYHNGEFCHCFNELVGKLSAEELNRTSQIKLSSLDNFSLDYYPNDYEVMSKILERAKEFINKFGTVFENIIMIGDTGLGKTHLSLAIANEILKKGYSIVYDSAINILHKIEMEHFGRDKLNDTLSVINNTDLLIIDDLGTEYESPFYISTIYNIINTRLNMSKSTIISTNLSLNEIENRYSKRVCSRLTTMYICMNFKGQDVRFQKKQFETKTAENK